MGGGKEVNKPQVLMNIRWFNAQYLNDIKDNLDSGLSPISFTRVGVDSTPFPFRKFAKFRLKRVLNLFDF